MVKLLTLRLPLDTSGTVTWQRWTYSLHFFFFICCVTHCHQKGTTQVTGGVSEDIIYLTKSAVDILAERLQTKYTDLAERLLVPDWPLNILVRVNGNMDMIGH